MTAPTDVFDELAAMFMSPETSTDAPSPVAASKDASLEVLIVGHLPVRAGFWLPPFVDALARQCGPAAMVRLDDEHPTLELLRTPERCGDLSENLTLRESIQIIAPFITTWVVRGREGVDPEELLLAQPDRVTILSGADNAAVVRAYQIVKTIQLGAERTGRAMPQCGVAIVGAPDDESREAFERMHATAMAQLGVDLDLRCCLPQMDGDVLSRGFAHFVGERSPSVTELSSWIRDQGRRTSEHAHEQQWKRTPNRAPEAAEQHDAHDGDHQPQRSVKLMPKPSMELEPKEPGQSRMPSESGRERLLASFVDDLTPIQPRCPRHEAVELAVDRQGNVHLLAREAHLRDLRAVETWAHDHRELLAMACCNNAVHIDGAGRVICHLFTETPVSVSDLHHSTLQLHVLAPVQVDGKVGWYAAPLNETSKRQNVKTSRE